MSPERTSKEGSAKRRKRRKTQDHMETRRAVEKELETIGLTWGEALRTEPLGGSEWMPHALRGAKSRRRRKIIKGN